MAEMQTQQQITDYAGTSKSSDDNACSFVLEVLKCPLCSRQLIPMELDIISVEDQKYQRIWWTCSGLRTESCEFPTSLPENVFWTQRSMKEMKDGFFPLPNLHLLPPEYRHLYPKFFDVKNGSINKSFFRCMERRLVHPLPSNERPIRACRRKAALEYKRHEASRKPEKAANTQGSEEELVVRCNTPSLSTGQAATNGDIPSSPNIDNKKDGGCLLVVNEDVPNEDGAKLESDAALVEQQSKLDKHEEIHSARNATGQKSNAEDDTVILGSTIRSENSNTAADNSSDAVAVENSSTDDRPIGVMDRISRRHMDLLSRRNVALAKKNALVEEKSSDDGEKKADDSEGETNCTLHTSEEGKCEHQNTIEGGIPAEEIIGDKECYTECVDCFNFLRDVKDDPSDEGITRRGLTLGGTATPFRLEHFPSSIIDPVNWYRQVHLSGRTALDGFMAWYNLRYNRREYLDALAAEMCKQGVMKYTPSIPIKQQRIVKQLREEAYGRKRVDIETLKKSFDSSALRLQMAHRLGISNVEPVVEKSKETNEITEVNQAENDMQMCPLSSVPVVTAPVHITGKKQNNDTLPESAESDGKTDKDSKEEDSSEFHKIDFSSLKLPKGSASMISDYLSTGNSELDEVLHQKAVKQMQQAFSETQVRKRKVVEKPVQGQEVEASEDPMPHKQRRISELSQGKDEDFHNSFDGLLDEYYDEDEEFCAQIYGA